MTRKAEQIIEKSYERLQAEYALSDEQLEKLQSYLKMLLAANEEYNLTAITDKLNAINFHLFDSLELSKHYNMNKCTGMVDVGSGGGLPGIPLSILYPDLPIILVEVTRKKINFLWDVITKLDLKNTIVFEIDWRTFLRKSDVNVNLFCARASLQSDELFRMFKPSCQYNHSTLVYWASRHWEPTPEEAKLLDKEVSYEVGNKERKLAFFKKGD